MQDEEIANLVIIESNSRVGWLNSRVSGMLNAVGEVSQLVRSGDVVCLQSARTSRLSVVGEVVLDPKKVTAKPGRDMSLEEWQASKQRAKAVKRYSSGIVILPKREILFWLAAMAGLVIVLEAVMFIIYSILW